jgi:hypothetical protein
MINKLIDYLWCDPLSFSLWCGWWGTKLPHDMIKPICLAIDKFGEQIRLTHQQTTEDKINFRAVLKGNGCVSLELQMCITLPAQVTRLDKICKSESRRVRKNLKFWLPTAPKWE